MSFGPKHNSRKIDVDVTGVSADSPEVQKRLDRIERNYSALDLIFDDLEARIELDDRLFDDSDSNELPRKPR